MAVPAATIKLGVVGTVNTNTAAARQKCPLMPLRFLIAWGSYAIVFEGQR